MRLTAAAAACALLAASCAAAIGLDDLEFDRDGAGGSGGAGSSPSSTATESSPATSSTDAGSTGAGPSGLGPYYDLLVAAEMLPTGYWRLGEVSTDEPAADSSGDGSHGVYEVFGGTIDLQQPPALPHDVGANTSALFAGGARVEVPASEGIAYPYRFEETEPGVQVHYTISAWVSYATVADGQLVLSCYDPDAAAGWSVYVGPQTLFYVYGVDAGEVPLTVVVEGPPLPDDGAWHLLVFTVGYDAGGDDGYLRAFVDGAEIAEVVPQLPPRILTNACVLRMAYDEGADTTGNPIGLDEVALFPFGFDAGQVNALFQCGMNGACSL